MAADPNLNAMLGEVYNSLEGSDVMAGYCERHNVYSAAVLTVLDDNHAMLITERLRPRIEGKTVVEIGGGIGLLSLHLGLAAKRVYCIEANPMWSWIFAGVLLKKKPRNVSFLFGSADEFLGTVRGDVAVFCTHSDVSGMAMVARQFAPMVIDVYGELIDEAPEHFDATAVRLRSNPSSHGEGG